MVAIRSVLRWSFAVGSLIFLKIAIGMLMPHYFYRQYHLSAPIQAGMPLLFVVIAFILAMAFWTTRKPNGRRGWWGIAAGIVHLLLCGVTVYFELRSSTYSFTFADPELLLVAIGIASIVVFASRTAPPPAAPAAASMPGDRTHPWVGKTIIWVGYAAVYASGWFWLNYAFSHHIPISIGIGYFVVAIVGNLVATILHECGHAVAAWIFEMKLLAFSAGPLQWERKADSWAFKFRASQIILPAGAVRVVPTKRGQPRWHDVAMLAAAPLVNLITGLPALYVALHRGSLSGEAWQFIALFASSSLIAAVQNMLPYISETSYTDGARIVQILTNSPMADLFRVVMESHSARVTALRPGEMDKQSLRRACDFHSTGVSAVQLRIVMSQSYEDAGDAASAVAILLEAETIYMKETTQLSENLHSSFIIGHALLRHDASAARLWWNRLQEKKPTELNVDHWLARASLLWIEGRLAEADDAWRNADREGKKLGKSGAYDFDRDRCAFLRRELDLAMQAGHLRKSRLVSGDLSEADNQVPLDRIASAVNWPAASAGTIAPAL